MSAKNVDLVAGENLSSLTSLLRGETKEATAELQLTEECFDEAIDILQERYGDNQDLLQDVLR